jgi:hypothetical protein
MPETFRLGVTNVGVVMPAHSTASSSPRSVQSPGSVRLTADQATVLAKAHVTNANLAVLKKMHLTRSRSRHWAWRTGRRSRSPERKAAISS